MTRNTHLNINHRGSDDAEMNADDIPFTPAGGIASINVQDAIVELDSGSLSNPMTSVGDLIRGGTAGVPTRLPIGGSNTAFKSTGTLPEWTNTLRLSYLDVDEHTPPNPPSPPATVLRIYGSNSKGYVKNSGGTVVELGGSGGGGGGGSALTVADEGTPLASDATTLDFVGTGVTATGTGATKTITIPGVTLIYPLGLPYGTLDRSYTFDSTVESWTEDAGTLSATGAKLRLAGAAGIQVALEPSGAGDIADGEVKMDMDWIVAASGSIVFRASDHNNNYSIQILRDNQILLNKRVAGTVTSLGISATVSPMVTLLGHTKVMARFVGPYISLFLDDSYWGSWYDTVFTTGRIGFATTTSSTIDIDNVRVYEITSETQGAPGTGARV